MEEFSNNRCAERYEVKNAISFRNLQEPTGRIHSGVTCDLNLIGVSIFSSTILEPGTPIRLWLLNTRNSELTRVEGDVIWANVEDMYGDSPYWIKAGISFSHLNEGQKKAIIELLPEEASRRETTKSKKHILAVLP